MKVFRKRPGESWEQIEIKNTLEALQREVGGRIETVTLTTDSCVICNEEGRIKGLPVNSFLGCQFAGTILLVGVDEEEEKFCDIDEKIGRYLG